jgi:hypothetical protein
MATAGRWLLINLIVLNDGKKCATSWGTIRASRMLVKGIRMSKMQCKGHGLKKTVLKYIDL